MSITGGVPTVGQQQKTPDQSRALKVVRSSKRAAPPSGARGRADGRDQKAHTGYATPMGVLTRMPLRLEPDALRAMKEWEQKFPKSALQMVRTKTGQRKLQLVTREGKLIKNFGGPVSDPKWTVTSVNIENHGLHLTASTEGA